MTRRAKPWANAVTGKDLLAAPLPPPGADAPPTFPERQHHESRIRKAGRDPGPGRRDAAAVDDDAGPERRRRRPSRARDRRLGAIIVLILIVVSLAWYFVSDRLTPYTSQARVQAFVVPVAAEVSGKVLKVHVKNNDEVQPGQPLFDIDPTQYRIALQRSRSDYESVRLSVNASTAAVEAARASLQAAVANQCLRRAGCDATGTDLQGRSRRDLGPPRRECAGQPDQGPQPGGGCRGGSAPRAGDGGRTAVKTTRNCSAPARRSRRPSSISSAPQVVAPAGGSVTDLRTDVGQFAQAGAPAMTLIAIHDLWISADMTENNLGNIKPGDKVAIVLDVMPGEVLKGRVRSVGTGISPGKPAQPGTPARGREQPRLAAAGAALPGGRRVRPVRARAPARRAHRRARPTCWSTRATMP